VLAIWLDRATGTDALSKALGKRPRGRSRKRCDGKMKMQRRTVRPEDQRWIELVQDRVQWRPLVSMVLNIPVLIPRS
jgi:hypothetical protein